MAKCIIGMTTTMTINVPRIRVYVNNVWVFFLSVFLNDFCSIIFIGCSYNLDVGLL